MGPNGRNSSCRSDSRVSSDKLVTRIVAASSETIAHYHFTANCEALKGVVEWCDCSSGHLSPNWTQTCVELNLCLWSCFVFLWHSTTQKLHSNAEIVFSFFLLCCFFARLCKPCVTADHNDACLPYTHTKATVKLHLASVHQTSGPHLDCQSL